VTLLRYPEGNQLKAMDPRLRRDNEKNTQMAEVVIKMVDSIAT
jgi:hypothetical protein